MVKGSGKVQREIREKRKIEQKEIEAHRKTIFTGGFDMEKTIGINYHYTEGDVL